MTSEYISSGLVLQHMMFEHHSSSLGSKWQHNDVCSLQFRPRSSTNMTFEHFSSNLGLHSQHNGVCWQHFRPRSSMKRKVYDLVRLIFRRREIFFVLTILNNTVHASSMFVQSSSGSTHLCSFSYSLALSKMANFVCNFWGGEGWINYMIECILIHMLTQKMATSYAIFEEEKCE